MTLEGRHVLVTGANRGIGSHFVTVALERSAACVYAGARDPTTVEARDGVVPVRIDVTEPGQIAAAAAAHPDIDVIVSNAGAPAYGPVLDTEAALRHALEVNLHGPLALVRAFRPLVGVVFVLSVSAVALSRSAPAYSASKAGALMTALAVREQLRDEGTAVTLVLPGFVDTEMSAPLTMPKADPGVVAARSLDGWAAGEPTVWPDAFAELVRDRLGSDYLRLLDRPGEVATEIQAAYRPTTA